jgi:hypothetical protein
MRLTSLDFLLWAAGFVAQLALLFVLWYRRRARAFPYFTALIALNVIRTTVLYFVLHHGTKAHYAYSYWSAAILDVILQLCVVYEVASRVFRPLDVWARDVRSEFAWLAGLSLAVAFALSWLESTPARTWMQAFATKGNLFTAVLESELFVFMMALSLSVGIPWRNHVAKIAQGLGAYALISVLFETGHGYFGMSRELPVFIWLSHVRMAAYLGCVSYWIVSLWNEERAVRTMTEQMRANIFALQTQVEHHLQDLRSRNKL